jgi:hypothetical protein
MRKDGLSISQAVLTIRYLAGKTGVPLTEAEDGHLRGLVTNPVELFIMLGLHGFTGRVEYIEGESIIDIDPASCPDDATPEERERLAGLCASRSAAMEYALHSGSAAEAEQAADRAYDDEVRWCLTNTIVFLRRRAATSPSRPAPADTAVTPPQ